MFKKIGLLLTPTSFALMDSVRMFAKGLCEVLLVCGAYFVPVH